MTIKTGGTIIGAVVQNLPIVIDGQKSIYEEGLKNGTLPASTTFKQFLDMLSVGVTDDEVDKKVAAAVSAEFIRLGLGNKNGKPPIEQGGNATTKPAEQGNTAPVQVVDKGKVNASKDIYAMENILVGGNIIGANMGVGFRKTDHDRSGDMRQWRFLFRQLRHSSRRLTKHDMHQHRRERTAQQAADNGIRYRHPSALRRTDHRYRRRSHRPKDNSVNRHT